MVYTNAEAASVRAEGSKGWIEYTWFKENSFKASSPALLTWKPGPADLALPCVDEKQDFIDCVRSRREPIVPAEVGHRTATMCQLGHIAVQLGERLKWDAAAERFVGNERANALLARPHREPWRVPGC